MKRILSILLCLAFILIMSACDRTDTSPTNSTNSTIDTNPIASFDTIESFNIALKKNPNQYMGNCVSVKGYMNKMVLGSKTYTNLEDVLTAKDELRDPDSLRLRLFIDDFVWLTVVGYGDYVEICGTVAIENGEICLKYCSGIVITAAEEFS